MKKTIGVLVLLVLMIGCKHDRGGDLNQKKNSLNPLPKARKLIILLLKFLLEIG